MGTPAGVAARGVAALERLARLGGGRRQCGPRESARLAWLVALELGAGGEGSHGGVTSRRRWGAAIWRLPGREAFWVRVLDLAMA